eukprot:CAMPEP_0174250428 /NCGR_PEP_ID=MMETSP0439-20130205/601_1 /TAXON_ID=0 /ORGANISM="Stereomyxa ramosa, Strain Chinc5" /LENGTH=657 /DNA_ID=CAMNT_0015330493 /DNA_START=122 /DNA_END=2095 /DNA_ORIENTATION=-
MNGVQLEPPVCEEAIYPIKEELQDPPVCEGGQIRSDDTSINRTKLLNDIDRNYEGASSEAHEEPFSPKENGNHIDLCTNGTKGKEKEDTDRKDNPHLGTQVENMEMPVSNNKGKKKASFEQSDIYGALRRSSCSILPSYAKERSQREEEMRTTPSRTERTEGSWKYKKLKRNERLRTEKPKPSTGAVIESKRFDSPVLHQQPAVPPMMHSRSEVFKHFFAPKVKKEDPLFQMYKNSSCSVISRCSSKAGYLTKLGFVHKNWRLRYFVLVSSKGLLFYFTSPTATAPQGVIDLMGCEAVRDVTRGKKHCFQIYKMKKKNQRKYIMYAADESIMKEWIKEINYTCKTLPEMVQSENSQVETRDFTKRKKCYTFDSMERGYSGFEGAKRPRSKTDVSDVKPKTTTPLENRLSVGVGIAKSDISGEVEEMIKKASDGIFAQVEPFGEESHYWQVFKQQGEILVSKKKPPKGQSWGYIESRVEGRIFAPIETLIKVLKKRSVPFERHRRVLAHYDNLNAQVQHITTDNPYPFIKNRDFVVLKFIQHDEECDEAKGNQWVVGCTSINTHLVPQKDDYARGLVFNSGWVIEEIFENGEQCFCTYVMRFDPRGMLPSWMKKVFRGNDVLDDFIAVKKKAEFERKKIKRMQCRERFKATHSFQSFT